MKKTEWQMWLDSFDKEPTSEEMRKQLKKIRKSKVNKIENKEIDELTDEDLFDFFKNDDENELQD